MPLTGYISIGLPIGPGAENDPYFVTDPKYGLGGLRTVTGVDARNNIVPARREVGMIVYVQENSKYYNLVGGTGNANWAEIVFGGSGASGGISSVNGITAGATGNVDLRLDDLSNVITADKINNDSLFWDTSTSKWVLKSAGISAGNFIILAAGGTGGRGKLPAVDGSDLLEVNAKYLDGKLRQQITDGGFF